MKIFDEKQYVIDAFSLNFEKFIQKKLVLYGIGKNTQYLLDHFREYNFVGLMDEVRTGEVIYGKNIISKEQVLASGVDTIIIVARANNIRIIYRRIAEFCAANSISVYDINGNILDAKSSLQKSFDQYNNICMEALEEKIAKADVVSFDIFDTLIMRRGLYPKDIFLIMEEKMGSSHSANEFFAKTRIQAEMDLYGEGENPTIHKIYDRMQQILKIPDDTKELWKELELATEEENLLPRKSMCAVLDLAASLGKEIFLVSDMYLPRALLHRLLGKLGIHAEPCNLIISCDYGISKCNGLYNLLRNKAVGKKILHIGDNFEADEQAAKVFGIDDTFRVKSALNMLEDSYACNLLKYDSTLYNRVLIGDFISRRLNDPFIFNATRGKFLVDNNYDMAYSFLAPIICGFFGWMIAKAKELGLEYILFSARDGYLMEEISKLLRSSIPDFPETQYFYTSRSVSVLAGLDSDKDILYAAHLAFAGSLEEMLRSRFFLTVDEIQERRESNDDEYILKHKDVIIKHSKAMRKNYLRYLESLPIGNATRIGFFDFVSSGTCQKGVSNFTDFELYGLYFVQLFDEYKKDLNIESMFGIKCAYKESYYLLEDYFFMENILTSYEPTLLSFDETGHPVFLPEKRTERQFEALKDIHNGILDYIQHIKMDICKFKDIDKTLPDLIFHLLHSEYSMITTDYFKIEVLEDEFCNRRFILAED